MQVCRSQAFDDYEAGALNDGFETAPRSYPLPELLSHGLILLQQLILQKDVRLAGSGAGTIVKLLRQHLGHLAQEQPRLSIIQVADAVPEHDAVVVIDRGEVLHFLMVDANDLITPSLELLSFLDGILGVVHELDLIEVLPQQHVSDVTAAAGHFEGLLLSHRREPLDHFLQLHDGRPVDQVHAGLLLRRGVFDDVLPISS